MMNKLKENMMNKLKEKLNKEFEELQQAILDNDIDFTKNVKAVYECLDGVYNPEVDKMVNAKIELYNKITEDNNQMIINIKKIIEELE